MLTAFIHRPIATSLLAGSLLLAGLAAYPRLPVASVPQVDFPTIEVSATLPGANPETMASNVAAPLERQLSQISGVTQMTSRSGLGATFISVQFDLSRNIDGAAQDVQTAITASAAQLPTNLPNPPTYTKINPADSPVVVMEISSDALPLDAVGNYAATILVPGFSQIPGVGQVLLYAPEKPAVRIQVDPTKLAAIGLDLEAVRTQIASATSNSPKGTIDAQKQSFTVYDNDQLLSAEEWNNVIVGDHAGAPIRIRDIGRAVDSIEDTKEAAWAYAAAAAPPGYVFSNGKVVILGVFRQPNSNLIHVADEVKAKLVDIER